MEVIYKIDDVEFKAYNVFVSASEGLLSRPKPKKAVSVDWADYHGQVVDLSRRKYESREIELDCFIKADSQGEFVSKCNDFLGLFDQIGSRRLEVYVHCETTPKPLVYEVYLSDSVDVVKKWSSKSMVGTLKLKLIEPEPIKRVFKFTRKNEATKTVSFTYTSAKLLNFYWGDGAHAFDASGTAQTLTHDYTKNGTYYIVVTGNIDEITSLTSTGVLVWEKL